MKNFFKSRVIISSLAIFIFSGIQLINGAPLKGTYTINKTGSGATNFTSFQAAVDSLTKSGVSGPVHIKVASDSYNEQIEIPAITGVSWTNTITFQSDANDSSKVILSYASAKNNSNNYTVSLNGCHFVSFKEMTIQRTGTDSDGAVIWIGGSSVNDTFSHCVLKGANVAPSTKTLANYSQSVVLVWNNGYSQNDSLCFYQNLIKYGSYGMYLTGSYYNHDLGNIIQKNILDSSTYNGIYIYSQDSFFISGNTISNIRSSAGYGISLNYYTIANVNKNTIYMPMGGYGLYAFYASSIFSTGGDSSFFANNMITMGGTSGTGIYAYGSLGHWFNFYYNSVLMEKTNGSSSTAFEAESYYTGTFNLFNNILDNRGTGFAFHTSTSPGIVSSDFNDLYTNGNYLGYVFGNNYSSLSTWKNGTRWVSGSSFDANSISKDAPFVSNTDLHLAYSSLRSAVPLTSILDDIDGNSRGKTPNIGADEVAPLALDASIDAIDTPSNTFCPGSQDIVVTLSNPGTTTLTSASIKWQINGGTTTSYSWTGSLAFGNSTSVKIGSSTFAKGVSYNLSAYTTSANGKTDSNPGNDSTKYAFTTSMSGTFTIGGSSADYSTFTDAVTDLNAKGVCGATVFNIADGKYNEQIEINNVRGTSSINTITFQSSSQDSSKVILYYAPSTFANNYVLHLLGANYFTFKNISIQNTGKTYGTVLEITNQSNDNLFYHNSFKGVKNYNGNGYIVSSGGNRNDSNIFIQNRIKFGTYQIYWNGSADKYIVFKDNILDSGFSEGIVAIGVDSVTIINNNITNILSSSGEGIGLFNYSNSNILSNVITMPNGGAYGINSGYLGGPLLNDSSYIANNMISIGKSNASVGINVQGGDINHFVNIYFNSVLIQKAVDSHSVAFFESTTPAGGPRNVSVINNIFDNETKGHAFFIFYANWGVLKSDYNDLYSIGNVGHENGNEFPTLADWQFGSKWDANSVSFTVPFKSKSDLHLTSAYRLRHGIDEPTVPVDIDGEKRSVLPLIGADEIKPFSLDAGIASIDSPIVGFCGTTQNIYATLINSGTTTLTSDTIRWQINGGTPNSYAWTGSIPFGGSTSIMIGTYTFSKGTTYNLTVYSSSPNGGIDSNYYNDSISRLHFGVALGGTYQIGGAGKDYNGFKDAVTDLTTFGVCGPVTFNAVDSTYKEQILIGNITGTSSTNTVTFQSKSGDSSKVKLQYAPSSLYSNYVLFLQGASYINFNKITIQNTSKISALASGIVVEIDGGSTFNTFTNNRIIGLKTDLGTYNISDLYSSTDGNNYNSFIRNSFKYGNYGILWSGATTKGTYNVMQDNILDSAYTLAISISLEDSFTFLHNSIINMQDSGSIGLWLSSYSNSNINKNSINMPKGGYGMYISITNSTVDSTYICNNMISMGGRTSYGIYGSSITALTNFYDNSILMQSKNDVSSAAFYVSNPVPPNATTLCNNIFDNRGLGYAINDQAGILYSNHNDLYSNGPYIAYELNIAKKCSYLSQWHSASGFDSASVSKDAPFISTKDLHLKTSDLRKGIPLASVTDDIDGDRRNKVATNLGADELKPLAIDAAISAIDTPGLAACSNPTPIVATLENAGTTALTSADIYWEINGGTPSVYHWKGSLSFTSNQIIRLGTYSFSSGVTYNLKVYVASPNGITDSNAANDTAFKFNTGLSLSGTYQIGGVGHDYANFKSAIAALNAHGICGPVVFNVSDSTYKEQIRIGNISGTSPINTVTIQSKSGDSSKVILTYPSSGVSTDPNYVLSLDSAKYLTINKITIKRTGNQDWGQVVSIAGGCKKLVLKNNRFIGLHLGFTYYGDTYTNIESPTDNDDSCLIENNLIKYGQNGMVLGGAGTNDHEKYDIIRNNIIDSSYSYGIYVGNMDSISILHNRVTNILSDVGIGLNDYAKANVIGNYIYAPKAGIGISIHYSHKGITATLDSSFFINNMIVSQTGISESFSDSQYSNFYFNSVLASMNCLDIRDFYSTSNYCKFYNNILDNNGKGYVINMDWYNYGILSMDYNDLYTNGPDIAYAYSVATYKKLSDWQKGSTWDAHSISKDPAFVSKSDLHLSNDTMRHGIPMVGITNDIDGDPRSPSLPDIGADEYRFANDVGIYSVISPANNDCGDSNATVRLMVYNYGTSSQSGFYGYYSINGGSFDSAKYTKTLAAGSGDTLVFVNKINTFAGGSLKFKAFTNLATDMNHTNDTIITLNYITNRPSAAMSVATSLLCEDQQIQFNDASSNKAQIISWSWNFGDPSSTSNTSSLENPKHQFSAAGTYTISLKVTSSCNISTTSQKITINSTPNDTFTFNIVNLSNKTVQFLPKDSNSAYHYSWTFGDGNSDTVNIKPTHSYSANTIYLASLSVRNSQGCKNTFKDSVNLVITNVESSSQPGFKVQLYPNPFKDYTIINYTLERESSVQIIVLDVFGNVIANLVENPKQLPGDYSYKLDPSSYNMSAGVYLVKIKMNDFETDKMIFRAK